MSYSAEALARRIGEVMADQPPMTVMEVCGTHTHAIRRWGIRQLLPGKLRLLSGPGCPVCVTDSAALGSAVALARRPDTLVCSFGDMLRVPWGDTTLGAAPGARLAQSPMDALRLAQACPDQQVVWFAVGFETTTAHTAALLEAAEKAGLTNLSVLCAHKTMPAALRSLLAGRRTVDGLLCPGHVAAVTGAEAFRFLPVELGLPAAVAGFTPEDILLGLLALASMRRRGLPDLVNAYPRAVKPEGNAQARALTDRYFQPCAARWRGLGEIPGSGLALRPGYAEYDALRRFPLSVPALPEPGGCRCGEILLGVCEPADCPHFGRDCTPEAPIGPCMVSSEGSCAAAWTYGEETDG